MQLSPTRLRFDAQQLEELALQHPSLAALGHDIERWESVAAAARLEACPDFELSAAYRQRDFSNEPVNGSDFVSAAITVSLPIWRGRKEQELAAAARLNAQATQSARQALALQIRLEIRRRYLQLEGHRERHRWLRSAIIPQAQQALSASLAGYQVDRVDFLTLLDSQVNLLDYEVDAYGHLTEVEKILAKIEMAAGTQLFSQETE